MKKYMFTSKNSKEAISTCEAVSEEEATLYFAETKKLNVETFLQIYQVSEVSK
jgi:hypothetical protein